MERLTYLTKDSWGIKGNIDNAVIRLAEIEDIIGDEYNLDWLRELVEDDWDGRCVVLPCKVGDTVYLNDIVEYEIDDAGNNQYLTVSGTVTSITICGDKKIKIKCKESGNCIWILGETAFLTQEAAETALNEMKEAESK